MLNAIDLDDQILNITLPLESNGLVDLVRKTMMFFIPLTNPFTGSILLEIYRFPSGSSFNSISDFFKWIDPVYRFAMGIKNTKCLRKPKEAVKINKEAGRSY